MSQKVIKDDVLNLMNKQTIIPSITKDLTFAKELECFNKLNSLSSLNGMSYFNNINSKNVITKLPLSYEDKLDLVKMIIYLIAPHNEVDINDSEILRLKKIKSLFERFDINVNMNEHHFFSTFLNFSIFFRQEKIAMYFIDIGADINMIDSLGMSALNYTVAKILIGDKGDCKKSMMNSIRDKIKDKGMVDLLNKMINHKTQKLEYFHKNPATGYCIYDAYATSQIPDMESSVEYKKIYEILSHKIRDINLDTELSKHYAVELVEFKNSYSADNTKPEFFKQYKVSNKGNIFEYIISSDEDGAIKYLKKNPKCVDETDIDLQNPLQWAIFMSQKDKPKKLYKLIIELIKAGCDVEHHNITGYNSIELAAWYDYCDDKNSGNDEYKLLVKINEGINLIDTNNYSKNKEDIIKYQNLMKLHKSKLEKKTPVLRLKLNEKEINKIDKDISKREINDMYKEDIRLHELNEQAINELCDLDEQDITILSKKSQKNKSKKLAKKLKDAERKAQRDAKLKAQEEAEQALKIEKEKQRKAIREEKLKAEEEARIQAQQLEIKKSEEAEKKLKLKLQRKAEFEANKLKLKQEHEQKILEEKLLEAKENIRNQELINERDAKIKAEKEANEAKLIAIKAAEMVNKMKDENIKIKAENEIIKKENNLIKTENEKNEKESCTSDITDSEDISENSNLQNSYHNQVNVHNNGQFLYDKYGQVVFQYPLYQYVEQNNCIGPAFDSRELIHLNHIRPEFNNITYLPANYVQQEYLNYDWRHPYQPTGTIYFS